MSHFSVHYILKLGMSQYLPTDSVITVKNFELFLGLIYIILSNDTFYFLQINKNTFSFSSVFISLIYCTFMIFRFITTLRLLFVIL